MPLREVQASAARQGLADLFSEVVRNLSPVKVTRRGGERAVLIEEGQLREILAAYRFSPKRSREPDGTVSYWLPELELYANAPSEERARDELLAEVLDYAADYLSEPVFRHARNRRHHAGWVLRAALAPSRDELLKLIFGS